MSTQTKFNLKLLALIGSVAGSVIIIVKAWAGMTEPYLVMPQRVETLERRVDKMQIRADADHDVLSRIDERTGMILEQMKTIGPAR